MKLRIPIICLAHVLLLSCALPPVVSAVNAAPTESQKIESLIADIANLKDAQFIRKGEAYDAGAAAQFMRGKWSWKSSEIKTARDFVRVCSAGGSGEGTPYYIQYKDGRQVASKDYLTEQLDKLENVARPTP